MIYCNSINESFNFYDYIISNCILTENCCVFFILSLYLFYLTTPPAKSIMAKLSNKTGCSADGSALGSGPRGPEFKSPHSDQKEKSASAGFSFLRHFIPVFPQLPPIKKPVFRTGFFLFGYSFFFFGSGPLYSKQSMVRSSNCSAS